MAPSPDQFRHLSTQHAQLRAMDFPWCRGPRGGKPTATMVQIMQGVQAHMIGTFKDVIRPMGFTEKNEHGIQELQSDSRLLRYMSCEMLGATFDSLRGQRTVADTRPNFRQRIETIRDHGMIMEPGHPLFHRGVSWRGSGLNVMDPTTREQAAAKWLLARGTDALVLDEFARCEDADVADYQLELRRDVAGLLDTPPEQRPENVRSETDLRKYIFDRTFTAWEDDSHRDFKGKGDPVGLLLDEAGIDKSIEEIPLPIVIEKLMGPAAESVHEENRRLPAFELLVMQRLMDDGQTAIDELNVIAKEWSTLTNQHNRPAFKQPRAGLVLMACMAKHGLLNTLPPDDLMGTPAPVSSARNIREYIFVPENLSGILPEDLR